MKTVLNLIITLIVSAQLSAQTIEGKWKTIDDETGKAKSIVEIYKKNDGKYYGKVVEIIDPNKQEQTCEECDDDDPRKDQKVLGMEIIKELELDDDEYSDGKILDPNNGTDYDCKMWIEDGNLKVRGYVLFFYRTQTWLPVKG